MELCAYTSHRFPYRNCVDRGGEGARRAIEANNVQERGVSKKEDDEENENCGHELCERSLHDLHFTLLERYGSHDASVGCRASSSAYNTQASVKTDDWEDY